MDEEMEREMERESLTYSIQTFSRLYGPLRPINPGQTVPRLYKFDGNWLYFTPDGRAIYMAMFDNTSNPDYNPSDYGAVH